MLLQALRQAVLDANLELVRRGLVLYTFGNASGISRKQSLVAIKPSGVPYESMSAEDIVVTDLSGKTIEGKLQPSSDLATHIEIYKYFPEAGGVALIQSSHGLGASASTNSLFRHYSRRPLYGPVPVTTDLTVEIAGDYEKNTGLAICRFDQLGTKQYSRAPLPGTRRSAGAPHPPELRIML
jgi:L-ribulose-5-phosphate 4-epimerase